MGKFMFIQNRFMKLILFFFLVLGACKGNLESRHYPSGFKIPLPEKDFDSYGRMGQAPRFATASFPIGKLINHCYY